MNKYFLILSLILMICLSGQAGAEPTVNDVTYYIPELEMSVNIPVAISCITRQADETNAFFDYIFDYESMHQMMEEQGIYLYGITMDFTGELAILAKNENPFGNFNEMDDATLASNASLMKQTLEGLGMTNVTCSIHTGKKIKALRLYSVIEKQGISLPVVMYTLTHESGMIVLRYSSLSGDVSDEIEKMIHDICDSITWGKQKIQDPPAKSSNDIYTDPETGLSFLVPSGWNKVNFVTAGEGKKIKYRIGEEAIWMLYQGGDMWETAVDTYGSLIEKYDMKRKDIGNDFFTKGQIAGLFGSSEDDITMKTLGGQEYYCVNFDNTFEFDSVSTENQMLIYTCIRDAYLYWFQLSGTDISGCVDQFNDFMETIQYP